MGAPGFEDFDFSLFKNTNVWGEKLKSQFRTEFFNVFNRSNFEMRLPQIFNANGGLLPLNLGVKSPTVNTSRQIQFALKFIF